MAVVSTPVLLSSSSLQPDVRQPAADGESHRLSATIFLVFTVNRDRTGMRMQRLAQSTGRMHLGLKEVEGLPKRRDAVWD